jgi:hypothetical protein
MSVICPKPMQSFWVPVVVEAADFGRGSVSSMEEAGEGRKHNLKNYAAVSRLTHLGMKLSLTRRKLREDQVR